ncbi:MAG: DNA-directed RNA polymerase subunit delta [Clostridia bacterium]|jgi:DNA-directed RNA polymerase subunit delta|nr:DNA-directed RNA polymerase subunit delta [Clostridia bacterium]
MEGMEKPINPKTSEVDILYQLLRDYGQGQSFRELMQQVCDIKGIPIDNPQLMAAVHTEINLDNRFTFLGQGSWGLREWSQGKIIRRNLSAATSSGRTVPFQRRPWQEDMEEGEDEFNGGSTDNSALEEDVWEE